MARRKLEEKNIRKVNKSVGGSYYVTLPIEFVNKLNWKKKQKVVLKLRGKNIIISDWNK